MLSSLHGNFTQIPPFQYDPSCQAVSNLLLRCPLITISLNYVARTRMLASAKQGDHMIEIVLACDTAWRSPQANSSYTAVTPGYANRKSMPALNIKRYTSAGLREVARLD